MLGKGIMPANKILDLENLDEVTRLLNTTPKIIILIYKKAFSFEKSKIQSSDTVSLHRLCLIFEVNDLI